MNKNYRKVFPSDVRSSFQFSLLSFRLFSFSFRHLHIYIYISMGNWTFFFSRAILTISNAFPISSSSFLLRFRKNLILLISSKGFEKWQKENDPHQQNVVILLPLKCNDDNNSKFWFHYNAIKLCIFGF